jgi:hypothetical protein
MRRTIPLGFQSVGTKTKGQPNIVPLENEEGCLVRKSFELIQAGNDRPANVLRVITDMGLRSKKGKKLTQTTFLKMLRNPVYIGLMKSKKWGTRKGLHAPLVSEHIFCNVQLILKGKKPVVAPYSRNRPDFPLRRFLRCRATALFFTAKDAHLTPAFCRNCTVARMIFWLRSRRALLHTTHSRTSASSMSLMERTSSPSAQSSLVA